MKILLTASPGTGKSTIIDSVVQRFPGSKGGIVAREILNDSGERTGFTAVDQTGAARQFMYRTDSPDQASIGGLFNVDIDALDNFVVPALNLCRSQKFQLIFVDEIGRAQARSAAFLELVRVLLSADNSLLGSIVFEDEPWSLEFKQHAEVILLPVTLANRSFLPDILLAAYQQADAFCRLNRRQKQAVSAFLKHFLDCGQFMAARKLFTNAIGYVIERKVEITEEKPALRCFKISGQSRAHELVWHRDTDSFVCDCDLSNGRGDFADAPEICSHQMSVQLLELA
ncbi:MAG TPA: nucleoside-triphosphatase [Candidatus Obscuribacter sp.]|nr:nucleoside-triphosphatase [Candidatus Obscuribacter sp.]